MWAFADSKSTERKSEREWRVSMDGEEKLGGVERERERGRERGREREREGEMSRQRESYREGWR